MSRRTITGLVSRITGDKTIVVNRTVRKTQPLYGKKYTTSRNFHVHDETNQAKPGDKVIIIESKPYSKTVVWELKDVLARGREELEDEKAAASPVAKAKPVVEADDKEAK